MVISSVFWVLPVVSKSPNKCNTYLNTLLIILYSHFFYTVKPYLLILVVLEKTKKKCGSFFLLQNIRNKKKFVTHFFIYLFYILPSDFILLGLLVGLLAGTIGCVLLAIVGASVTNMRFIIEFQLSVWDCIAI